VRWRADSAFSSFARRAASARARTSSAFPRNALALIELQDPAGDVVEEVAVVRDRDHRARVLLEIPFEPRDGLGVEMVRGARPEQHIGLLEEEPAQRDTPLLAAGQDLHTRVAGCTRSASIAISIVRSRSHPFTASIWSCRRACSASAFSISASDMGAPSLALTASNAPAARASPEDAVLHVAADIPVESSCGSCGR